MIVRADILPDPAAAVIMKLAMSAGGLWLLCAMSGHAAAAALLTVVGLVTYGVAAASRRAELPNLRRMLAKRAVPAAFGLIVALNVTGFIGTLTGASAAATLSAPVLLAAPFYFLSAAAFIADIAGGRLKLPSFLDYFTYLALPFKLLAGPLEPPNLIARLQVLRPRLTWHRCFAAWPWIALGAVMKFVIAGRLLPAPNLVFETPPRALLTATTFELKFYFDFAGYSFICCGLAQLCGLRQNKNFTHPFFARNVVMFWRMWHISLGQFLSRYILLPNVSRVKGHRARMVFTSSIFMVSAMWHGGTANYFVWGLFHGSVYYCFVNLFKNRTVSRVLAIPAMLAFFVFGRFLACESNWPRLLRKLANLVDPSAWVEGARELMAQSLHGDDKLTFGLIVAFFLVEAWSFRRYGTKRPYHFFRRPLVAIVMVLIFVIMAEHGTGLLYARL